MTRGCSSKGPAPTWFVVALAVVTALPALVRPADAVVICQRKNKVTLRADKCAKKETLVADLATVTARGNDLATRAPQVDTAKLQLGFLCPGNPALKLVVSKE